MVLTEENKSTRVIEIVINVLRVIAVILTIFYCECVCTIKQVIMYCDHFCIYGVFTVSSRIKRTRMFGID